MTIVKSISLSPEAYEALSKLQGAARQEVAVAKRAPIDATASRLISNLILEAAKAAKKGK